HGVGGPLAVSDLTESHPVSDAWIAACEQAGIPRNDDFNGADQEGAGYFQLTQKRGRRCSAAVGYLEPVRSRPNLSIVTGVLAERILIDNGRVTGVACRIDGKEHLLRARGEVVLTAGALGSPKLLQLSGIGPAERLRAIGIDVVRDLPGVGGNLQDHYTASLLWRLKAHVPSVNARAHGLALLREIAAYMFQRRGLLTLSPGNIGVFCKSRPELATPDIEFCCFPASPDISKAHKSTLVLERDPGLTTAFNILRPQSRGQVWLRSSDPAEPIAIQPNYLDSQADADVIVAGFKWARRIARQPAMAELIDHEFLPGPQVETDEQILGYCRAAGGTGYHPTGTCAMGHGAATAVDPRLRVHGVAGLRVADASIMPTIVSGNTNAPTIMIAEKAAAMILQDAAAWTIGHTTPTHALPRS
ncbi:MAG: GMC oxidoreductase, partial [Sphingobium sp.]